MPRGVYPRMPVVARFWAKVDRSNGPRLCWEWQGARGTAGYGVFESPMTGRKAYQAHRASWELHAGAIPAGLVVMHICDNPPCVNPAHLRLGTPAENSADMAAKGRAASRPGPTNPRASLSQPEVSVVWRRAAIGESHRSLAQAFGVSQSTISRVLSRPTWRAAA